MAKKETELYKKYRPRKFSDVHGQDGVLASLQAKITAKQVPHAILFIGPSGVGKTTITRILAKKLKCGRNYKEVDAADNRGIDMVRAIKREMMQAPLGKAKCKMYCIDEAHKMSPDAMNALLKPLENTPSHVYFVLCTTDPQKIIKTIQTRCTQYKLTDLTDVQMIDAISDVIDKEGMKSLPEKVLDKVLEVADGSARRAIVLLDALQGVKKQNMLSVIGDASNKEHAFAISKALMNTKIKWKGIAKILLGLKEQNLDAETLRYMILGYAQSALLKGWGHQGRAFCILDSFRDNFYDSKFAGLVAACYEVVASK